MELNQFYNIDCMEYMKTVSDKFFELAIVDPPYGIKRFGDRRVEISNRICVNAKINEWDIKPDKIYFDELFRISKYQIIWGGNNFLLPETEYFIVWDKKQTVDNFASAEFAWTNIKIPAKIYTYSIHMVMRDRKHEGGKIHPTQKPVALYRWLLQNYAKPGDKIFDSHVGSGSSIIACIEEKHDYVGCELDKDYYDAACERIRIFKEQLRMF